MLILYVCSGSGSWRRAIHIPFGVQESAPQYSYTFRGRLSAPRDSYTFRDAGVGATGFIYLFGVRESAGFIYLFGIHIPLWRRIHIPLTLVDAAGFIYLSDAGVGATGFIYLFGIHIPLWRRIHIPPVNAAGFIYLSEYGGRRRRINIPCGVRLSAPRDSYTFRGPGVGAAGFIIYLSGYGCRRREIHILFGIPVRVGGRIHIPFRVRESVGQDS